MGKRFKKELNLKIHIIIVLAAVFMTVFFTVLDDIISPLYYGLSLDATKAYAIASLTAVVPQVICTLVTVLLLLPVLIRVFSIMKIN